MAPPYTYKGDETIVGHMERRFENTQKNMTTHISTE
jgi:hypothetical protein